MRKIYSLFLLMLLPLLAVAQDNMAITSTSASSYYSTKTEKRLVVAHAAAGVQQEAMTTDDAGINISIGMWIKTTSVLAQNPNAAVLFRIGTGNHANSNGALQLLQTTTGALQLTSGGDNIGNTGVSASMGTASFNEWHHILLTLDSENNAATVYVDGEQTGTSDAFGKFGYKWGDGLFQFVCLSWSGAFDELQLFNTALTAEEAQAAYANARSVNSLTSLYTFDAVKSGSTNVFESTDGSVTGSDATWQAATYDFYWAEGLASNNGPSIAVADPALAEGREIAPTDVTVMIMDGEGGTLTATDGATTYDGTEESYTISTGTTLTLTATPDAGYDLISIYATSMGGDIEAEIENGGTYVVKKDVILTARYTNETYTLTVANELNVPYTLTYGGEEVTDLTQLMGGGAQYSLTLDVPESVILESVQLDGQDLTASNGVYTITLDADATLTINARNKAQYTVTINQPTGGTVAVAKGTTAISTGDKVYENDVLTLSNTKDSGYTFVNYVINGSNTTAETYTVTGDVTISALFEEGVEYCYPEGNATRSDSRGITSLTVSDDQGNTATVTGAGTSGTHALYTDQTSTVFVTKPGATVTIKNNGSGTWMSSYVYVDYDKNGTFDFTAANCAGAKVDGELVSHTGYSGTSSDPTVTCTGSSIDWQASFTLTMPTFVIPEDLAPGNYRIRHKVDWNCVDPCGRLSANGFSDNFMDANGGGVIDFTIRIESEDYETARTITVASADETYGTVAITDPATSESSISTVQKGVTVKATPATGYAFLNWTDGENNVVATTASYTYTGETDVTLTAHFGYAVNFTVGANGLATVTADGNELTTGDVLVPGTEVKVTTTPNQGKVAMVEVNGNVVTVTDNVYTFTVEAETNINITFVDEMYNLSIVSEGNGSIQVWTGYNLDNPNSPAGVQIANGGIIPTFSDDLEENMRSLECYLIPGTNSEGFESIETIAYTIGGVVTEVNPNDEGIPMDSSYEIPADFNEATIAFEIPLADVTGDVVINVTFSGNTQGIGEIGIDEANGPVEFYNLQGVRVAAENLVPGFYIVRQGNTAKKVFIRK